jgi:rod shape-determining protein MreD|tara:strand:+ start:24498 stop:24971 length:474 start_codon:yes stop_codon:yes gene_type:complete
MILTNFLKILATIIFANYLDSKINFFMVDYYLSFSLGFLVFCFWVFSLPNNIYAVSSFIIGLLIDLILGSPFGLNALLFTISSFIIHSYRYSFKIFSFLQITIFFAFLSMFYLGFINLFVNTANFSYLLIFLSFFLNGITWISIYILMNKFKTRFYR